MLRSVVGYLITLFYASIARFEAFVNLVMKWAWADEGGPIVARMQAIRHKAAKVRHRTGFSSRVFMSTGFYSAATAA